MSSQEFHDAISQKIAGCGYPVDWQGSSLGPPSDPEYVRLSIVQTSRRQPLLNDDSPAITRGMLLIDCFSPIGAGMSRVHELADEIGALFDRADRIFITNGIIQFPHGALVRSPLATGAHVKATVQISYEVYQ